MAATAPPTMPAADIAKKPFVSQWSSRYRGVSSLDQTSNNHPYSPSQATVEDLEPPAALSLHPTDPVSLALLRAYENDYTHLTITDATTPRPARLHLHPRASAPSYPRRPSRPKTPSPGP